MTASPSDYLQTEINRLDEKIAQAKKDLLQNPELQALAKEEILKLEKQKESLLSPPNSNKGSTQESSDKDPLDSRPAIIEIRAAAGGDEAKIWANDLMRMYMRACDQKGLNYQILDDLILKITSKNAFALFKYESGIHRVQRVPTTESQGRIHTSTATVAVLPEITSSEITINPQDLEWQFTRSGGPGGQNVNKLNTAVRLTHKPSQTFISVRKERSQQQNREIALEMLRTQLWQISQDKQHQAEDSTRKSAVGRGMRAEKIRTYNFPQNRITDHRINKSWYNLETILNGNLDKILATLEQTLASA